MGDNYLAGARTSPCMCAMAAVLREGSPLVEPSNTTHTPPDPRADTLTNAQAHATELRALPAQGPPPVNPPPWPCFESKEGEPTGAAHRRSHGVHSNIVNDARMQLPRELCTGKNIAAAAILFQAPEDPVQRALQHQVKDLLELTAVQQAESSSLQRRQAVSCPARNARSKRGGPSAATQAPPVPPDAGNNAPTVAPVHALLPPRPLGYDAWSMIRGRQQARRDADANRAAA
jgi:hypothetical protein